MGELKSLYEELYRSIYFGSDLSNAAFTKSKDLLNKNLAGLDISTIGTNLFDVLYDKHQTVLEEYGDYLQRRSEKCPPIFRNKSHIFWYLIQIAPTKLVDGVWLRSIGDMHHLPHSVRDNLKKIYKDECSDGDNAEDNHAVIYRKLLNDLSENPIGLDPEEWTSHPLMEKDDRYLTGILQMSLAIHAADHIPEIVGYNLGYEQIANHIAMTAKELPEHGIDGTYFSLHVSVDNFHTGHARSALNATREYLNWYPQHHDRIVKGYLLSDVGTCAMQMITEFNEEMVLCKILYQKGLLAHSLHNNVGELGSHMKKSTNGSNLLKWLTDNGYLDGDNLHQTRLWKSVTEGKMKGAFTKDELCLLEDWWNRHHNNKNVNKIDTKGRILRLIGKAIGKHGNIHMMHPCTKQVLSMEEWYKTDLNSFYDCISTPEMKKRTLDSLSHGRMKNIRMESDDLDFLKRWCTM